MKVLIAIEDSRCSELALESIKLRLWEPSTEFTLCSIVPEISRAKYLTEAQQEVAHHQENELLISTRRFLSAAQGQLKAYLPSNNIEAVVRIGPVAESIVDIAQDLDADVIVMGSHCRKGVAKFALGSVVEAVVSAAPCSVEIIRMSRSAARSIEDVPSLSNVLGQRKILVCYDGSPNAKALLNWIAGARWAPEQEFAVLTVLAHPDADHLQLKHKGHQTKERQELIKAAEDELAEAIKPLRLNADIKVLQPQVCEGSAADTILEFAKNWCADVILLGAHTERPNADPVLGSVARKVATETLSSIRVVREKFDFGETRKGEIDITDEAKPVSEWAVERVRRANEKSERAKYEIVPVTMDV